MIVTMKGDISHLYQGYVHKVREEDYARRERESLSRSKKEQEEEDARRGKQEPRSKKKEKNEYVYLQKSKFD